MLPVLAAFGSAILHPFYPVFAKKGANALTVNFWGMVLAIIIFSFCFFNLNFWQQVADNWKIILLSSFFHAGYILLSLSLIAKHEFQVLYPLTRLAPIFILIGEYFLLGTSFSFLQIFGIVMVGGGALIFGFDKNITKVRTKVLISILVITLFVTGFHLTDKKLLEVFTPAEMWASVVFHIPLIIWPIFVWKKEAVEDIKNWRNLLKFEIAAISSWYLALWAMQFLSAAVVFSIRNLSILFGVFLGAHIFKEGHKKLRYLAAVLIVVGVAMMII